MFHFMNPSPAMSRGTVWRANVLLSGSLYYLYTPTVFLQTFTLSVIFLVESVPSEGGVLNRAPSSVTRYARTKKAPSAAVVSVRDPVVRDAFSAACLSRLLVFTLLSAALSRKVKENVWTRDTRVFPEFHHVSQSLLALVVYVSSAQEAVLVCWRSAMPWVHRGNLNWWQCVLNVMIWQKSCLTEWGLKNRYLG